MNTAICGAIAEGSSRLATRIVTMPGMPELLPKTGLPHFGQKLVVTVLPLFAFQA